MPETDPHSMKPPLLELGLHLTGILSRLLY